MTPQIREIMVHVLLMAICLHISYFIVTKPILNLITLKVIILHLRCFIVVIANRVHGRLPCCCVMVGWLYADRAQWRLAHCCVIHMWLTSSWAHGSMPVQVNVQPSRN